MTRGGPGTATNTLAYIMYKQAFITHKYGYGLSAASVLVLECLVVILILNFLFREREDKLPRKGRELA